MSKIAACIAILCLLGSTLCEAQKMNAHSYRPEQGFVPDEAVAMAIAEAIVTKVYGASAIARQKPFVATLEGGVWTVSGTLPKKMLGGTFLIEIDKNDARVIRLTHGK